MDHRTVIEEWRRSAQTRDDEKYEFLRSLKFPDYGYDTDELAAEPESELRSLSSGNTRGIT